MFRAALAKTALPVAARATRTAPRAVRPVIARAYHEKVISHYENPRNVGFPPGRGSFQTLPIRLSDTAPAPVPQVGSMPKTDTDVGTGLVGAPAYVFPLPRRCCRHRAPS